MGSCISKCKPKRKNQNHHKQDQECKCQCIEKIDTTITSATPKIQDKLVISQATLSSPPKSSPISPSSPLPSSPSLNSSCTKTSYPTTSSSSSSCSLPSSTSSLVSSSSTLSSKSDQSFSNEFLWSCVKENSQILRADYLPIKISNPRRASLPTRSQNSSRKSNGLRELPAPSPQRVVVKSTAQKRPRCSSPSNLTRQKSFRREPDVEPNRPTSRSGRLVRPMSPSSSRRFSGELSTNQGRSLTSVSMRRENGYVRPPSPSKSYNTNSRRNNRSNNILARREKEEVIKGVSSKIKELTMGDLVSNQDLDLMPIEDADNPHIALDCFIFL